MSLLPMDTYEFINYNYLWVIACTYEFFAYTYEFISYTYLWFYFLQYWSKVWTPTPSSFYL